MKQKIKVDSMVEDSVQITSIYTAVTRKKIRVRVKYPSCIHLLGKSYDLILLNKQTLPILRDACIQAIYIIYIKSFVSLYENMTSYVKQGTRISQLSQTTKALRQGCCLTPILYKIYLIAALQQWLRKCHNMGNSIKKEKLFTLLSTDDQVSMIEVKNDINYMLRKLDNEYIKMGTDNNSFI